MNGTLRCIHCIVAMGAAKRSALHCCCQPSQERSEAFVERSGRAATGKVVIENNLSNSGVPAVNVSVRVTTRAEAREDSIARLMTQEVAARFVFHK